MSAPPGARREGKCCKKILGLEILSGIMAAAVLLLFVLALARPEEGWLYAAGAAALVAALLAGLAARLLGRREREFSCLCEELIQSQKLAALGELSAGIAHEINNPLAIIGQETELLTEVLVKGNFEPGKDEGLIEDSLAEIAKQVGRCGDITHKMLDLARMRRAVPQLVNLPGLLSDMAALVTKEASDNGVEVLLDLPEEMPRILTDSPLVKQIVLNLLNNAVQATPGGGQVILGCRLADHDALVTVRDTGPGILEENLDKIFNPFFTTKPPGKGTGLGLSISQRIVHQLGGRLSAENDPDRGAVFTLRLPRAIRQEVSHERAA